MLENKLWTLPINHETKLFKGRRTTSVDKGALEMLCDDFSVDVYIPTKARYSELA